jgi:hypothetical protein
MRGVPSASRRDNGPEIVAKTIPSWLAKMGVQTLCIEPGSPWQSSSGRRAKSDGVGRSAIGQSSGDLSWPAAGRVSEPRRVCECNRGQATDLSAERRCQPPPAARLSGVHDPGGVRSPQRRFRSWLRPRTSGTAVLLNPNFHAHWCNTWGQVIARRVRENHLCTDLLPPAQRASLQWLLR